MTNKQAAAIVLKRLREAGFTAFFAGGCVRDTLIGREPKDYDVATDAAAEQVCRLFRRRIEVGVQFGVVIVLIEDKQVEVATFRADGVYVDGRRPERITYAKPREDALRRDFTINGIFYDPLTGEVIDYVGGREDIKAKRIRTIGKAALRFSEDYLRMLRGVRFAAELGYEIEKDTWREIKKQAHKITNISGERISCELERIFACQSRARGADLLVKSGLMTQIFPSLTPEKLKIGIKVLSELSSQVPLEKGLAALMCECSGAEAAEAVKPLKLSNNQLKAVRWALDNRAKLLDAEMKPSELRPLLADERFDMAFDIQHAYQRVKGIDTGNLDKISRRAEKFKTGELMPEPLLNGNEIIALGAEKGPRIGELCRRLYNCQLNGEITTKDQAIEAVKSWI